MTPRPESGRSRPYAATGGRTRALDGELGIDTQVTVADGGAGMRPLSEQHRRLLTLCATPRAVSELAGVMQTPVGVVAQLVDDLHEAGLVAARAPLDMAQHNAVSYRLLERVLEGLKKSHREEIEGQGIERAN